MVGFLRALRLMFCLDMYLGVSMEVRGRSAVHHRENDGRSPSITLPDDPSMTMNICFPLCAYSMNHTGAWSNSPSYVVGYTWIDSRLSTRVFACFSANLWESAGDRHREYRGAGGFLRAGVAVHHHAGAGARADVLRPLEVRDEGRRDDPIWHVAQRDLAEVRALGDLPSQAALVQPFPARLEGGLVREFVFQHVVLLDDLSRTTTPHRGHGTAILAHDEGESGSGSQRPPA